MGLSRKKLDQLSNYPPKEAITEVFGCWLQCDSREVTRKDIVETLYKIGLQELSSTYALKESDGKCYK